MRVWLQSVVTRTGHYHDDLVIESQFLGILPNCRRALIPNTIL